MIARLGQAWHRLRSRFWPALLFDVAVLVAVFLAVHAWQTRDLPLDDFAPTTVLPLLDSAQSGSAVTAGRSGIVYFFAPWCRICRVSIGNLDELVDGGRVPWAAVVALDYADHEEVRAFIDRTGVGLPVLLGDARTAADWSIRAFPTYYVIDSEGRIASRSVGYSTWLGMWLRAWLAR